MNSIERVARGWPILLASLVLTGVGSARAQTAATPPIPGRAPLSVTVFATNPNRPSRPAAPTPRAPVDATLARFDQDPSQANPSPEPSNEPVLAMMPPAPSVYPDSGSGPPIQAQSTDNLLFSLGPQNETQAPPAMPYGYTAPQAMPYGPGPGFSGMPYGSSQQSFLAMPSGQNPGPNPQLNAMMNQFVSMPTSRSTSRIRVRGPGPVGAGLARFGERLTHFGRTRIESVQETELEAPLTQSTNGISTFSSVAARPTTSQQTLPSQGMPPRSSPQGPTPSPQSEQHVHKHHWWK